MEEDRIVKAITHYQQNLEKYIERRNELKMIYCMEKLQKLPITVAHLEHTGVGRTVNSVRKMKGIRGSPKATAKQLVQQWKKMVTEEEDSENENNGREYRNEGHQSNHEEDDPDGKLRIYDDLEGNREELETRNIQMDSSHYIDDNCDNRMSRMLHYEEERFDRKEEAMETRIVKHASLEECANENEYQGLYENYHLDNHEDTNLVEEYSGVKSYKIEPSQREDGRGTLMVDDVKNKEKNHGKNTEEGKPPRSHKDKEKENHYQNCMKSGKDRERRESGTHRDKTPHSSVTSSSSLSKVGKERDRKDKDVIVGSNKIHETESAETHRNDTAERECRNKENKDVRELMEKRNMFVTSKRRAHEDKKVNCAYSPAKRRKLSESLQDGDGIDCESGTSFADALGMMTPSKSSSSRKSKASSSSSSTTAKESGGEKRSDRKRDKKRDRHDRTGKSTSNSDRTVKPPALQMEQPKPIPLDSQAMSNWLPQVSTNYKPVGFLPGDNISRGPGNHKVSDDEMLSKLMYAKNARTKVYSGNKVFFGKVPSLRDCCIRLLQDNIDALVQGYTGGVPYFILKPVLERASPSQLFNMEHYNSYLMEDSDELWKLHVSKEFKAKTRNEMETWREMYLRCIDERDAKLKSLTANIKLSQDKSLPVRQTKLAYVDTVAKGPRGSGRKNNSWSASASTKPAITPSSRLSQLAMAGGADKICVPNPGASRANAGNVSHSGPSGNNYIVKPKKAPLMAKILQLMKGRFRK